MRSAVTALYRRCLSEVAIQDRINGVRRQLGQARTPDRTKPDLTDAGLEALHVCLERLQVRSQVVGSGCHRGCGT